MEPKPTRSRLDHEQAQDLAHQQQSRPAVKEFATAEELIRHDAAQTAPPPGLEERVKQSIAAEPPPTQRWWKRLFGR
ncbi:MAG: hypothetical protein IPM17_06160 [Verrucomicrobia bacterium]|jgi:hypothetical protein|nr:hypothetical protein [Verrucomicrobiota bacterium]